MNAILLKNNYSNLLFFSFDSYENYTWKISISKREKMSCFREANDLRYFYGIKMKLSRRQRDYSSFQTANNIICSRILDSKGYIKTLNIYLLKEIRRNDD
jgi:hypothetical protein